MTEPSIDYRRMAELFEEFDALWRRLQALYLDSVVGFHFISEHLRAEQTQARTFVEGSELHYGQADKVYDARQKILDLAFVANPERFVKMKPKPPTKPSAVWITRHLKTN